jgi:hypothetical protein
MAGSNYFRGMLGIPFGVTEIFDRASSSGLPDPVISQTTRRKDKSHANKQRL